MLHNSEKGVNEANGLLANILINAVNMSLPLKKTTRRKQGSNTNWFNKECKEARKQFHIASNDRNTFPQNEQLKKDLLKQYKKRPT